MDPALRVLEAAERVRGSVQIGKRELSASQLLERLGLRGDRQWAPVGDLSGGERRRLQLMLLLLAEPNVLLLDEPTNDLDIETLTELEDLLDGWPGSVVAVSHDRYFLERVTDHVLALTGGQLAFLPGGVDEYLAIRDRERAVTAPAAAATAPPRTRARGRPGTRPGDRPGRGGPAAGRAEGAGPAGAPDQPAGRHRGRPQRPAGGQRHRLRPAGRARGRAEGGPGGAGRAGGTLAGASRGTAG